TALPRGAYDAALTANSLHWLPEPVLRRVYADLAALIRAGGMACNADPMAADGANRLIEALERHAHQMQPPLPAGELDWEDWWQAAAADPVLAPLVAERTWGSAAKHPHRNSPRPWPGTPGHCGTQASPKLAVCGATGSEPSWPHCDKPAKPVYTDALDDSTRD